MAKEKITTLGEILNGDEERDAIHVAVAPVIADEFLKAGQHVGFVDGSEERVSTQSKKLIGIIDPFLKVSVRPEQRIFLVLYPQTVKSLRHHWEHPSFPANKKAYDKTEDFHRAEKALREFAKEAELTYEELLEGARQYLAHGNYLSDGGKWEGFHLYDKFWDDYGTVTQIYVHEDNRGNFFSCSCM